MSTRQAESLSAMKRIGVLIAAIGCLALSTALAEAVSPCPDRIGVGQGETLGSLAERCGVNAEALKQANPGSHIGRPRAGTYVVVPARPLPSPPFSGRRRPSVTQPSHPALSRDPGIALRKTYPGTLADRVRPLEPSRRILRRPDRPWELPRPPWAPPKLPFQ